ncbi:MAG TPA: MBL fold metallo-hydrolase [candidate division Zixibacteria bacterium]|nr:MBL fold metallo-hydrolase [candidate division Zixibacteria bacterium]
MELTWYGLSCFRLSDRGMASVVTDPYDDSMGLPSLKLRGDVVTISHDAVGHNHAPAVAGRKHTLNGPGEYEIGGVFITGISTASKPEDVDNVLFVINYRGLTIAHLGDMAVVPTQTQIEALEQVNVLLVPVGGGSSLNAAKAAEVVSMLEPSIVVPMHYHMDSLNIELEDVDRFLKEMGSSEPSEEVSLRISDGNLPEETEVVLLTPKT